MTVDDNYWGVFDTWQDRWCPAPRMSFIAALHASGQYNEREAIGAKRYVAKRLPEPTSAARTTISTRLAPLGWRTKWPKRG